MGWRVSWRVTDGPFGARANGGEAVVRQGETVAFTLLPSGDAPVTQAEDAGHPENWQALFQVVVTGEGGAHSAPVVASRDSPLRLSYAFRYEGPKTLSFTGTPRAFSSSDHSAAGGSARPGGPDLTMFPPVNLALPLEVLSSEAFARRFGDRLPADGPEGTRDLGAAATTHGADRAYRRREHAHLLHDRAEAAADAARRESAREDRDRAAAATPGGHRPGLLLFEVLEEPELSRMTVDEAADYAGRLNEAIHATPTWNMNRRPVMVDPVHQVSVAVHWEMEEDGEEGIFYQAPGAATQDGAPAMLTDRDAYAAQLRRESEVRYRRDEWVVVILPGGEQRSVISVGTLLTHRWDALLSVLQFVAELAAFEVMVVMPLEMLMRGVSLLIRLFGESILARGATRAALRSAESLAGAGRAGETVLDEAAAQRRMMERLRTAPSAHSRPRPRLRRTGGSAARRASPEASLSGADEVQGAAPTAADRGLDAEARGTGAEARGTGPSPSTTPSTPPEPRGEEVFRELGDEMGLRGPRVPVPQRRNVYPDFETVRPELAADAAAEATRLSSQLGIPIRSDRVLVAPWVGRVRSGAGRITSSGTAEGWLRDDGRFWSAFARAFPEDNALLGPGHTVTEALAERYGWPPSTVGNPLTHHHMGNGQFVAAIPRPLHRSMSGAIHGTPTVITPP